MARFPKGVQGPSAEDATKRLDDAVAGVDDALRLASEFSARVEKAKAGILGHERARLAHKYGDGSAEALRAEVALRRQSLAVESAVAEAQTARIPITPLDEETTRVHGRAMNRKRAGIAGIEARLLDAQGKAVAKTATDENGYFRLDVKPRPKSGRAKAAGRLIAAPSMPEAAALPDEGATQAYAGATQAWELVLRRGQQKLAREIVRDVEPGRARYVELVVEKK